VAWSFTEFTDLVKRTRGLVAKEAILFLVLLITLSFSNPGNCFEKRVNCAMVEIDLGRLDEMYNVTPKQVKYVGVVIHFT